MDNNIKENLTNTLVSVKDYFINWHNTNYEVLHQRTSIDIDNKINQLTANDIATTTDSPKSNSVQKQLNDLDKNLKAKASTTLASNSSVSYDFNTSDTRGANIYGKSAQQGLMKWQDKVKLDSIGTWYQVKDNNNNTKNYLTIWFNPMLRLCQMSYEHYGCTKLKNQKKYEVSNNSNLSWDKMIG